MSHLAAINHLVIAPLLIPLIAGIALLLMRGSATSMHRLLSIAASGTLVRATIDGRLPEAKGCLDRHDRMAVAQALDIGLYVIAQQVPRPHRIRERVERHAGWRLGKLLIH